jgi:flagellar motor switch protein FliM
MATNIDRLLALKKLAAAQPDSADPEQGATRAADKFTRFDPKHSPRPGEPLVRALEAIHAIFAGDCATALSSLTRSSLTARLLNVERSTCEEFVERLEVPTSFGLVRAEPFHANLAMQFDASIVYPILDRLLGGAGEASPPPGRPLTAIELRLARRVSDVCLAELRRAWERVAALDLAVLRIESDPRLAPFARPTEAVFVARFELALGQAQGAMQIAFPCRAIEPFALALSALAGAGPDDTIAPASPGSMVELVVRAAETRISASELAGLGVGDLILTEKDANSPLVVEVDGIPRFYAMPGTCDGQTAIRIVGQIPEG